MSAWVRGGHRAHTKEHLTLILASIEVGANLCASNSIPWKGEDFGWVAQGCLAVERWAGRLYCASLEAEAATSKSSGDMMRTVSRSPWLQRGTWGGPPAPEATSDVGLAGAAWDGARRGAGSAVQPGTAPCTAPSPKGAPPSPCQHFLGAHHYRN